jgi:hypothetical protein
MANPMLFRIIHPVLSGFNLEKANDSVAAGGDI